jgi:hypothetical protein
MTDINYVPQIDYTSKDYTSIKEDLIDLIPAFVPSWTNRDPADFGMALIELFSYMGDILNYYIDRSANEAFIGTASQRDSVLQISRLLGYNPTAATAATVTLTFYNSSASAITVPVKTKVATTPSSNGSLTQIIFETNSQVVVPAKVGTVDGSITVTATQGYTVTSEEVGTSTGTINQVWKLQTAPLITGSISVVVGSKNFSEVPYLIDYNNYDPVFSVYTNAAGSSFILFGDNISGIVPDPGALIYATYRVGGGVAGNVAVGAITSILNNTYAGLRVNNLTAASGGSEEETTDSIRVNAPLSLKALNRAVSLADYSALATAAGVAKANAVADVYTSVTIYYAPSAGDLGVEVDGVTPSTVFNNFKTTLTSFLTGKVPANTTITFQPPTYVATNITATITVLPQYRRTLLDTAVTAVLTELLAFDNVGFRDTITLTDVISAVTSIEGVAFIQVEKLVRNDADLTYTISNKAASGTVATLTTSATHALTQGSTVKVTGVDSTFNGTFVVKSVTSTTFTYDLISSVVSSVAASGAVTKLVTASVVCAPNEIPKLGTLSLTFNGGINN